QVALARVAENRDHDIALAEPAGYLQSRAAVGAGRDADQQALVAREAAREQRRILVADGDYFIVDLGVEIARHEARADSLDLVETGLAARQHLRVLRLNGDDQYFFVEMLAQVVTGARNRAAGADAGDKSVDARELLEQLGPGASIMDVGIGGVAELLRHEVAGIFAAQLLRLGDRAMHPARVRRQHQLRAVRDQQRAPLFAHRVGHRENQLVAFHRGDQREADTGVAGGRLDNSIAGLQAAGFLGRLDHREADSVLNAAAGIEVLE